MSKLEMVDKTPSPAPKVNEVAQGCTFRNEKTKEILMVAFATGGSGCSGYVLIELSPDPGDTYIQAATGKTFDAIREWLNKNGYVPCRCTITVIEE